MIRANSRWLSIGTHRVGWCSIGGVIAVTGWFLMAFGPALTIKTPAVYLDEVWEQYTGSLPFKIGALMLTFGIWVGNPALRIITLYIVKGLVGGFVTELRCEDGKYKEDENDG